MVHPMPPLFFLLVPQSALPSCHPGMHNTYEFTEHAQPPGYDHVIVRANGEFIGCKL